jgi:hypothetical protein
LPSFSDLSLSQGLYWPVRWYRDVCTYSALERAHCDLVDIVAFPHLNAPISDSRAKTLDSLATFGAKRLAIRLAGEQHDANTELDLEEHFGPVIYREPEASRGRAQVEVVLCDGPLVNVAVNCEPLVQKLTLWQHEPRNRSIAQIASTLAANQNDCVSDLGIVWTRPTGIGTRPMWVAVLVESARHGQVLQRHLADWPLLDLRSGQLCEDFRHQMPARSIMTLAYAAQRKTTYLDAVVVASGGDGIGELSWIPPANAWMHPDAAMLLVDVLHDDDQPSRDRARARIAAYEARGWRVRLPARWS